MKLTLLVSLKEKEGNWSLRQEINGAKERKELGSLPPEGVVYVGRDALLFDETQTQAAFAQVCACLLANNWPYCLLPVDESTILLAGMSLREHTASHGKMMALSGASVTMACTPAE